MRHPSETAARPCAALRPRGGYALAAGILAVAIAPTIAAAQSEQASTQTRIDRLEQRLDEVLGVVESLKSEIARLKARSDAGAQAPAGEAAPSKRETVQTREVKTRVQELSEKVKRTNQRLASVEKVALDVDERVGSRPVVNTFDAESLDLGGFLHTGLTLADGEANTEVGVNRLTTELLIKADLSESWSLFAAQAFIRESGINFTDPFSRRAPNFNVRTKTPLVIATATYRESDSLVVDAGRFITPHGIVNIEHFPATLLDPEQPQFLRPFSGQTIFANFMNGAKVSGQFFQPFGGEGGLGYEAYVGSFVGNADSFNYGGRLDYSFGDSGFTLGANFGGGRRDGGGSDYVLAGADLLYDKGPIIWKNEVFVTDEERGGDRLAAYTQPGWRITENWTGFYRFDFLDDGQGRGDQIEHAVGVNFDPHENIRLRAIARFNEFEAAPGVPEADAQNYQISATFSF